MRSVLGVLAGLAVAIALMIGTNILMVKVTTTATILYFGVTLAGAAIYHMGAGYLCALIARDAREAVAAVVILGTAMLLTSVIQTWSEMPKWYSIAMVLIVPVSLYLGTRMHRRNDVASRPLAAV